MKKSLLALAVLGAFAGAASAQTNVTVYGVMDLGIERSSEKITLDGVTEVNESRTEMNSGMRSGSRLGFKGSEDLGGGLSAIFTLESGFNADNGNLSEGTKLFNRQAWLGLKGGFGAVKLGRQETPIFLAIDSVDPFGTGLAGDMSAVFNGGGVRMDNTINYSMPNIGGFYGQAAYGFGEQARSTGDGRQLGLSFGYANGPLNAVLAYHNAKTLTGANSDKTVFVGGTYDFNVAKAHVAFANNKGVVAALGGGTADGINFEGDVEGLDYDLKSRDYMIGVSAPVGGAGTVMASFQRKDFRNIDGGDAKVDVFAIGYAHNLSKRTSLYTSLGRAKGEVEADGVGEFLDAKATVFNAGIRHMF